MDIIRHQETIELIREVFHYSHLFQNKTFVFKVDYPVLQGPFFKQFVKDLSLLHSVGIRAVIVPGARERIEEILEKYSIPWEMKGSYRISSFESLPFIKMAAFDVVNKFMTEFSAYNVAAVMGNWIKAKGIGVLDGVDYQGSGQVYKIDVHSLERIIEEGYVPIIPCIGWSSKGQPYNLNSNALAVKVADALDSAKLFFVNVSDGFFKSHYKLPPTVSYTNDDRCARLDLQEAAWVLEENMDQQGQDVLLQQLALAVEACKGGVERVHIIDGRIEGVVLKEIFSNLGIGTMVFSNNYEKIRPMEEHHIPEALKLMNPLVIKGALIPRTQEDIRENLQDYVVHEIDGTVFGIGALHPYPESQGEIAALAVNPYLNLAGIGKRILSYLENKAKEGGLKRVFVLTTQTSDWFENYGYKTGDVESLPEGKRKKYDQQRKSRVLVKDLL